MEEVVERTEGGNGHDLSGCITAEGKTDSNTPLSDLTPLLIGESSDCGEFELSTF